MTAYFTLHVIGCLAAVVTFSAELRRYGLPRIHGIVLPLLVLVISRFCARIFFSLESGQWGDDWISYFTLGVGASSQFAGLIPSLLLVWLYGFLSGIPRPFLYDRNRFTDPM
jgi:hypothetical protein